MSNADPEFTVAVGVRIVTDLMTDDELAAMGNVVQLDWDPREVIGYEEAQSLFTEEQGTRMHDLTKRAFLAEIRRRL